MKPSIAVVGLLSATTNLLALTGSIFMLQVYDRVLPGHSIPSLIALSILAAAMYLFQGILELIRSRLMIRIAVSIDKRMSADVLSGIMQLALQARISGDGLQSLRDMDQIRSFLSSGGPLALFDLPWIPIYLAICYVFHFWIGVVATLGALVLIALTLAAEAFTKKPSRTLSEIAAMRSALAEAARRNAEAARAMGFGGRIVQRWLATNIEFQDAGARASDVSGTLSTISRVFRMMLQSAVLATGAWLVIRHEATGGIMIASSIMTSRALAPIELAIANWKGFVAARQAWQRLSQLFNLTKAETKTVALPAPKSNFTVETVSVVPPGNKRLVVQDVTFSLAAGTGLGVIGPSASGKSSLVRTLVGAWLPARGIVRLDGAALDQWSQEALGKHIGYLPQDVQLFAGSIAQNIARFDPEAPSEVVLAAAVAAGVHDMIVHFSEGFETQVGEGGNALSAGQRQRVALARALYGDPFLVVLDEPNSNLDSDGDKALADAIMAVRQRGGVVIVVSHRPVALANLDKVLVMSGGRVQAFGPRDEVLSKMVRPTESHPNLRVATSEIN